MLKWSPKSIRIFKTLNLYLCFFTMGLCVAVPGPCLLDLQKLVNTDTQNIAFIYTARSVGYLVGSICGGVILDLMKSKQALMTFFNFLVAASMLAIPWSVSLPTLTGFMIVNGISLGAVDIGGNVVCLTLWGSDSGPYYQALHFTFGLGGLAAPLIAAPFLSEEVLKSPSVNANHLNTTTMLPNFSTESLDYNDSAEDAATSIVYPFSIIGGFGILVTILFLAISVISPTEEKRSGATNSKDNKVSMGFISVLVFLNFMLLFVETGTEIGYAQMLTTYVVKGRLKLSSSTGSYMTSAFWAAFTISRLASVFLAIKVSSFTLIVYDLGITMVGSFILLFLASYEWAMWLASVLLGVGIASFFPAAVAWLDSYINVTNTIASLFSVGAAFGEMVIPFTISYFIDTVPDVLIYLVPASSVSSTVVVFILYMILRKRPKKSTNKEEKEPECFVINAPVINT